jgi:hypothetical protein
VSKETQKVSKRPNSANNSRSVCVKCQKRPIVVPKETYCSVKRDLVLLSIIVCTCIHTCMYVYTCMYIYIYICTYVYRYICIWYWKILLTIIGLYVHNIHTSTHIHDTVSHIYVFFCQVSKETWCSVKRDLILLIIIGRPLVGGNQSAMNRYKLEGWECLR